MLRFASSPETSLSAYVTLMVVALAVAVTPETFTYFEMFQKLVDEPAKVPYSEIRIPLPETVKLVPFKIPSVIVPLSIEIFELIFLKK